MRIISLVLVAILLSGCGSLGVKLPAVSEGDSNARLPGKVIWHDLISSKPEESIRFYSELFGWEFKKLTIARGLFSSLDYYLISLNDTVIGGMVDQNDLQANVNLSQWVVAIATDNLDAAVAQLKKDGGTLYGEPVDLKARGKMAVVADKQGALFALLETKNGDPADKTEYLAGDFLWNELWTIDKESAGGFYKAILPYSTATRDTKAKGESYAMLSSQGAPRVGIMNMPVKDLKPTWVAYLRVENAASLDKILAKVESLGGNILLPAQDRLVGGRAALIADPSGAGIALQTWPATKASN